MTVYIFFILSLQHPLYILNIWYILVKSSHISNGASLVAHSKEYTCDARVTEDRFNLWVKKIPWRRA